MGLNDLENFRDCAKIDENFRGDFWSTLHKCNAVTQFDINCLIPMHHKTNQTQTVCSYTDRSSSPRT